VTCQWLELQNSILVWSTHMRTYTYIHTHRPTYIHAYKHTETHTHTHAYIHTYMHTYIHTYTYTTTTTSLLLYTVSDIPMQSGEVPRRSWLLVLLPYITPWSRVLLEKLIVAPVVEKFPSFHSARRFIVVFARNHNRSLS
jgi:hypothetical protein